MSFEDIAYVIGEKVEILGTKILEILRNVLFPTPAHTLPKFRVIPRLVRGDLTVHEFLSLHIQICFVVYLAVNFILIVIKGIPLYLLAISIPYFLYLRYFFIRYGNFLIEEKPYKLFYYGISVLSFLAFLGYSLIRFFSPKIYYHCAYIGMTVLTVFLFRHYFKTTFGRAYTYGIVEDVKGELALVSVHDDIRANVKPGKYWVESAEEVEVGDIVKVLVEERIFRSSIPKRVLEVHKVKPSSSETSTEPKAESERSTSK